MTTNINRSVLCKACSSRCIRWGHTPSGTVRYRCNPCKKTITAFQKKRERKRVWFSWFEKWVLEGVHLYQISRGTGYSIQAITPILHSFLSSDPPPLVIPLPPDDAFYLILDGVWQGKRDVTMLYRFSRYKMILRASFYTKEWGSLIARDLRHLKEQGYRFTGVVSDGGTGIRKAIQNVYGHIPHQICMAHMHRDGVNAIGRKPKDPRVQTLKHLTDHLWKIESHEARRWWKRELESWYRKNWMFLIERRKDTEGRSWYAHPGVRKAFRTLMNASEECFIFLTHHLMPKTTNELEGTIGNLTMKHLIHRGLKRERVPSFIRWYVYFYNRKLLS